METVTTERLTNEEILINLIQDFFDCRKVSEHLIFLDYWLEKILANRQHKKYLNVKDLAFFSIKFQNLLTSCSKITQTQPINSGYFEECTKISETYILRERELLLFYPIYLSSKEICNPLLALGHIFKNQSLDFYTRSIRTWATEYTASGLKKQNVKPLLDIYIGLKRMVEACWLIHERTISKRSYRSNLTAINFNHDFALSCPLLFSDEYLANPYLMVEDFFSFAGINEYREDLTKWFKIALNDQESCENASDLLFIHNQFLQLLHAGYLIGLQQLTYTPETPYTSNHETFGHWLLARMEADSSDNPIQVLSPHFKENPLAYCIENLTINYIIKMRYGLKEWLEAGLSRNSSITALAHSYIFDQFEELQKIMEALYSLIMQPTLADKNSLFPSTN